MGHRPTIALKRLLFCKKQSINSERKGVGAKRWLAEFAMVRGLSVRSYKKRQFLLSSGLRVADLERVWYVICRMKNYETGFCGRFFRLNSASKFPISRC